MAIKYSIQGLLIYTAMSAYLIAFIAALLRHKKTGTFLYLLGSLISCSSIAYRWLHVGHIPMQNLFEVFLVLGALVFPISCFCNRILHIGGVTADIFLGVIVLFPAGFIFNDQPQQLPPALQSWLFGPHVFVYMLSYMLMAKAAILAGSHLAGLLPSPDQIPYENATYQTIHLGFPLLTLGLTLGSIWGQLAWGDWWGWDPKELWSLASWLVYVGYLHFRYISGNRFPRINSIWAIVGLAVIIITLLWVNLSRLFPGLHSYAI